MKLSYLSGIVETWSGLTGSGLEMLEDLGTLNLWMASEMVAFLWGIMSLKSKSRVCTNSSQLESKLYCNTVVVHHDPAMLLLGVST